jgi:hypothetical protein
MSEFTTWLKNRDRKMYSEMAAMLGGNNPLDVHHEEMDKASKAENSKIQLELKNALLPIIIQKMNKSMDTDNDKLYSVSLNHPDLGYLEEEIEFLHPNNIQKMYTNAAAVRRAVGNIGAFLENLEQGKLSSGTFNGNKITGGDPNMNKRNRDYMEKLNSMVLTPLNLAYKALVTYNKGISDVIGNRFPT